MRTLIVKTRGIDSGNLCQRTVELDSNYEGATLSVVSMQVPPLPRTESFVDAVTIGAENFDVPAFTSLQEAATYLNGLKVGGVQIIEAYYDGVEFGIEATQQVTFAGDWATAIGLPVTLAANTFFYRVVSEDAVEVSHGYQVGVSGVNVFGVDDSAVCLVARDEGIPENSVVLGSCRSFFLSVSRVATNGSLVPLAIADDRVWSVTLTLDFSLADQQST